MTEILKGYNFQSSYPDDPNPLLRISVPIDPTIYSTKEDQLDKILAVVPDEYFQKENIVDSKKAGLFSMGFGVLAFIIIIIYLLWRR